MHKQFIYNRNHFNHLMLQRELKNLKILQNKSNLPRKEFKMPITRRNKPSKSSRSLKLSRTNLERRKRFKLKRISVSQPKRKRITNLRLTLKLPPVLSLLLKLLKSQMTPVKPKNQLQWKKLFKRLQQKPTSKDLL